MSRRTKEEVLGEFRCSSIQDAAMAVIARKGVADATMQDIAQAAGVAKATVYVYFRDRDELLTRTANRAFDRLITELDSAFTLSGTVQERLTAVVLRQLQFFDENRELFRAYIALTHREDAKHLRKAKAQSHARYVQRLGMLFAEARSGGEIGDFDPAALADVASDCIRGVIVRRIEEKSKTPREEQAAFVVSILLRGIRA
jgi:AcrR family transcriptional regulator